MSYVNYPVAYKLRAQELWLDGWTVNQIATELGVGWHAVRCWTDPEYNEHRNRTSNRCYHHKRSRERLRRLLPQMIALRNEGMAYAQVAAAIRVYHGVKCSGDTVRNMLRDAPVTYQAKPRGVQFGTPKARRSRMKVAA